jgi:hypothetical protein
LDKGGERLTENVAVLRSSIDGDQATIVLRTDDRERITITDAGLMAYDSGERIAQTSQIVDGRTTIRMTAKEIEGKRAVTIDTDGGLYLHWLDESGTGGNPFADTSSTTGWIGGAGTVSVMCLLAGYRHLRKRDLSPETGWPV